MPVEAVFDQRIGDVFVARVAGNTDNAEFVDRVVWANVVRTVEDIRRDSPILAQMEKAGKIKIVGAYYSLETSEVTLVK